MGERLRDWTEARYQGAAWHAEVPVKAPRAAGGQWNGSVDLLLRLPSGEVVLVDHKCGPICRNQLSVKAATYAGQLATYREALEAQGLCVAAMWIHFPRAGGWSA
jgi:ATP-dependent exoDNAse (exonuclease V) beta subunit